MSNSNILVYKSVIGKIEYMAEFRIVEKDAYMERTTYDSNNIKTFILVLKKAFNDLESKGIKKLVQTVHLKEWKEYLMNDKNWSKRRIDENFEYVIIECDIKNALECIARGFGWEP
jgi:hypothetical protein